MLALNLTHVGASHIRSGKECQDFSLSESNDSYSMAITCDGHGGDNYFRSALGSMFAAQAASACIAELMDDLNQGFKPSNPEAMLVQLEKSIIARWNAAVWEHFEQNPFTEAELNSISEGRRKRLQAGKSIESTYGTTLIALVQTEKFWFGIQIGDGKCVRVKLDGTFDMPIPVNDKCFLNSTTSICDENALVDFRHYFTRDIPVASFCGSDGIDDSFIREEQLYKLYETIARSFGTNDYKSALAELEDYMPRLSSKGSGDDVSIAGIIDDAHIIEAIGEEPAPEATSMSADREDPVPSKASDDSTNQPVWICPKCGNESDANYCSECGTRRPSHAKPIEPTLPETVQETPDPALESIEDARLEDSVQPSATDEPAISAKPSSKTIVIPIEGPDETSEEDSIAEKPDAGNPSDREADELDAVAPDPETDESPGEVETACVEEAPEPETEPNVTPHEVIA